MPNGNLCRHSRDLHGRPDEPTLSRGRSLAGRILPVNGYFALKGNSDVVGKDVGGGRAFQNDARARRGTKMPSARTSPVLVARLSPSAKSPSAQHQPTSHQLKRQVEPRLLLLNQADFSLRPLGSQTRRGTSNDGRRTQTLHGSSYGFFSPKGPTAIATLTIPVHVSVILIRHVFSGFEKLR